MSAASIMYDLNTLFPKESVFTEANRQKTEGALPGPLKTALNVLRGTPRNLGAILIHYGQDYARLANGPAASAYASPDELQKLRAEIDQKLITLQRTALEDIAALRADVESRQRTALAAINALLNRPEPEGATAALLMHQKGSGRAWNRMSAILGTCPNVDAMQGVALGLVKQALALSDDDAVAALRTEYPAYLAAHGAQPEEIPGLGAQIDAQIAQARPEFAQILSLHQEVQAGANRLLVAATQAEIGIREGDMSVLLPGWRKDETVTIDLPAVSVKTW